MSFFEQLHQSGEHGALIPGPMGLMEVVLSVPEAFNHQHIALLGHPHSLQGGTMNNKVVTSMARVFKDLGIASVRFNFRGVGASEGVYDAGLGESTDMCFLAQQCLTHLPHASLMFAGFSFGSYVAYRAAQTLPASLLISIAPPVHHYDYTHSIPTPWVVVQGGDDDVVSEGLVVDFFAQHHPHVAPICMTHAGHFFHGQLIALKSILSREIQAIIKDC